ncbi:MAG: STAS domain-containing protein [Nitrosospira sp.]|nr:STAS domain-containing protein [Nitrosospira sp.]
MATEVIRSEGSQLSVKGSVTINNVVALAAQGIALLDRDNLVIDLKEVSEVDSSAICMLLEWQREASRRNWRMYFANMPHNLKSLVQLYGVAELISWQRS